LDFSDLYHAPKCCTDLEKLFSIIQKKQMFDIASSKKLLLSLIALSVLYILVQVDAYLDIREAVPMGDTTSYLEGASLPLSDPDFFSERRPWGILLTYKILGGSFAAIETAQLFVSTISWLLFIWVFSRSVKTLLGKVVCFIVILGFSLTPTVQVWNHTALSESFTISSTVLILTILIALLQDWKWKLFFLLIFLFTYWMSIHEVNLYIGLLAALSFFILGTLRKQFRIYWLVSICIGVIFVINFQLSSAYGLPRWALPLAEVITKRILPNPEYLGFFETNGMPVTPELMALSGRWAHSDNYAIINSVELRRFSKWLFGNGNVVYARFLLAHPLYTIISPLEEKKILLATDYNKSIPIPDYTPALPAQINELVYPIGWYIFYFLLALITVGFIFLKNLRTKNSVYWLVFLFFFISIPYLYLSWHGDALDIARHAVVANIQFHLGIWLLLLLSLDKININDQRIRTRHRS